MIVQHRLLDQSDLEFHACVCQHPWLLETAGTYEGLVHGGKIVVIHIETLWLLKTPSPLQLLNLKTRIASLLRPCSTLYFGDIRRVWILPVQRLESAAATPGLVDIIGHTATLVPLRAGLKFLHSEQGHHPDIYLAWGKVGVKIWTHKIDGLTESDFILAAKIDKAHVL